MIIFFPFLLILTLLVKLSSSGPVFFSQERVGLNGKGFNIIKYRTMTGRPNANSMSWSKSDEERITSVGGFMRDYGLDELPQLLNILIGDMSIIGPRPPLPKQVQLFTKEERKMFQMRSGVLSLAAVEGRRSLPMEKRYELHVKYVASWSLKLDLKILWKSLFVVLGKESATEKEAE